MEQLTDDEIQRRLKNLTKKGTALYEKRVSSFDKRFKLLVDKGGLDENFYENHKHYYGLGYYGDT